MRATNITGVVESNPISNDLIAAVYRLCTADDYWAVQWDRAREQGKPVSIGPVVETRSAAVLAHDFISTFNPDTADLDGGKAHIDAVLSALHRAGELRALCWFACWCAWQVLALYERSNPNDERPRRAIVLAQRCAREPTSRIIAPATRHAMADARMAAFTTTPRLYHAGALDTENVGRYIHPGLAAANAATAAKSAAVVGLSIEPSALANFPEECLSYAISGADAAANAEADEAEDMAAWQAAQNRQIRLLTRLCLRLHRRAACGLDRPHR